MEEYIPCWVSACSSGDTTLEGGFNLMTLLVTENASFTVCISSWPWPCDSSLYFKKESKVSDCVDNWHLLSAQHSKMKFCTLAVRGYNTFSLWLSHHHLTAAETQTPTQPQNKLSTQPWILSIKQKRKIVWQSTVTFLPLFRIKILSALRQREKHLQEPILKKL